MAYRAQVHPCFSAGTTEPQVADARIRGCEGRRQGQMRFMRFAGGYCRCRHGDNGVGLGVDRVRNIDKTCSAKCRKQGI